MRRLVPCLLLPVLTLTPASAQPPFNFEIFFAPAPEKVEFRPEFLAVLGGSPSLAYPSGFPWWVLSLRDGQGLVRREPLPYPDPVAFLEQCLARYDRGVRTYSCTLFKQERIRGQLRAPEKIDVQFRESPFSVYFHWVSGADRKADKALYVEGQNNNKLVAVPHGVLGTLAKFTGRRAVERDVNGEDAKNSGRYPLSEFGFKLATERMLAAWKAARAEGALHVEYLGVFRLPEAGDRLCYKLHRKYERPEEGGIMDGVFYFDRETWLQVGSVLRDGRGGLLGEYFFSNVRLNTPVDDGVFDPRNLK